MNAPCIRKRIAQLQQMMQQHQISAYLVLMSDPHLSEYVPARWKSVHWLSGFTGSAATLVVKPDESLLWVDSRYWTQAEAELEGTGIGWRPLQPGIETACPLFCLSQSIEAGQTVGTDGTTLSLEINRRLQPMLEQRKAILRTDIDLLSLIWPDRPPLPSAPLFAHAPPYTAATRAERLKTLRDQMHKAQVQWHWISTLADIAWLLNLRGLDVDYNPVFIAHALIGLENATLFLELNKLSTTLTQQLTADGIALQPYEQALQTLQALPAAHHLLIDPKRVATAVYAAAQHLRIVEATNPTILAKACKQPAEIAHIRETMVQDGAALCESLAWIERTAGHQPLSEWTIGEYLTSARARRPGFVCPSFAPIVGFNENSALPHYSASKTQSASIQGNGWLLVDSGGQYHGGTTDVTRVIPIGQLEADQKHDFTRVLKSLIALSRARFPEGIRSPMLDAIARAPLWAQGLDFGHGTGHGVGYFLNVHEGPQTISCYSKVTGDTAMRVGMVTSIEPGIYRPHKWGVRIENLVVNQPAIATDFGEFLGFETLTLCPIDTRCLALSLLDHTEIDWLNIYHQTVKERLLHHVCKETIAWLEKRTAPL